MKEHSRIRCVAFSWVSSMCLWIFLVHKISQMKRIAHHGGKYLAFLLESGTLLVVPSNPQRELFKHVSWCICGL